MAYSMSAARAAVTYFRVRETEFYGKLRYFSDEGRNLDETDWWWQKADVMDSVTYIRVEYEMLRIMASQIKNDGRE